MEEIIAQQRKEIMVLKFKDMFDIIMLFSKHDSGLIQKSKSFVINDYSKEKMFVDVPDYCLTLSPRGWWSILGSYIEIFSTISH